MNSDINTPSKKAPTIPGLPILGHWPAIQIWPIPMMMKGAALGPVSTMKAFGYHMYLVNDPEGVKHVLVKNAANYSRKTRTFARLSQVLGNGILISEGEYWRKNRRIVQPAFHKKHMLRVAEITESVTRARFSTWTEATKTGSPVDYFKEMTRITMSVISQTMFGTSVEGEADKVTQSIDKIMHLLDAGRGPLGKVLNRMKPQSEQFDTLLSKLDTVVMGMIAQRRKEEKPRNDLLDELIRTQDEEEGYCMNDQQIRDEVMTVFLAGHDTTAALLTWTLLLLAKNPKCKEKLRREIEEVCVDRPPNLENLSLLPYLNLVLQESLRLYPPIWLMGRKATEDDVVCGVKIPKGASVSISPYALHRNPDLYTDPEKFWPERFEQNEPRGEKRYAFIPFGAGQRLCIGREFAFLEASIVLALILKNYDFRLADDFQLKLHPSITLRPKNSVGMRLTKHSKKENKPT